MMFHSHLPLQYWVETFATASYISNLLPSTALNNKSPYESLFNIKPDYGSLRVFGTACYPCLRPLQAHKFDPKSLQCLFLGYINIHKGYRCLYPPSGKVYISCHVLFDEDLFPFKQQYKELVPRYETALLRAWQSATLGPPVPVQDQQISRMLPTLHLPVAPTAVEDEVVNIPAANYENVDEVVAPQQEEVVQAQNLHLCKQGRKQTSTNQISAMLCLLPSIRWLYQKP